MLNKIGAIGSRQIIFMNGWNDPEMLLPLFISNIVALLLLISCWKYQRLGRLLMFLLFIWAGCTNWSFAIKSPHIYLDYANYAFLPFYRNFIKGWFSQHIVLMVGLIATCQLLIACSMVLKGWIFKLGTVGGMLFLVGIIPLGVGSGFPFPIIAAFAFYLLFRSGSTDYLWKKPGLRKNIMLID